MARTLGHNARPLRLALLGASFLAGGYSAAAQAQDTTAPATAD